MFDKVINLFNKNKKDVFSCQYGYKRLYFFGQQVSFCSIGNPTQLRAYPTIYKNFNGKIDINDLAKKIQETRENAKKGIVPQSCEGCHLIKDYIYNSKEKRYPEIEYIQFSDYFLCNSRCLYCNSWITTELKDGKYVDKNGSTNSYEILPIIKQLIEKGMITTDTIFDFAGGEPTIYRQFEETIEYLLNFGIKHIEIFTNAIKYSKGIERGIEEGVINITVSIDAGTKEIHKKVKGVETYDTVYENLQKYLEKAKNKKQVQSKYVIVDAINDTENEILNWIKTSKEIGIEKLFINADNRYFEKEL